MVLVGTKQELAGGVRCVGFNVCLRFCDSDDTDAHADGDPEKTLEHHSPLLPAA